jgi:aryl-alcohol dehydrogenase-like predicted oxidoreductase
MAAYTLLRVEGVSWEGRPETDPAALAHLALLEDVLQDRPPLLVQPPAFVAPLPNVELRTLGRTGIQVHPFGISGAHGLSFDDFALAHRRGVNLYFWEPSHRELGRFLRTRSTALVIAGTYHADAASIERDVVKALRTLRRSAIDVFLAFWTRSPRRIDEVEDTLFRLQARGLIRALGLSTHDRGLACDAADRGFEVVMVRHSAAHRGAESTVFPHCEAKSTGVLTFSNLCYGRMLHATPARLSARVSAPDCYRYSLSHPGVHACIAAPRRRSELVQDLDVVDSPGMAPDRRAELQAHGDYVYARSKAWSAETWTVADPPVPEARRVRPESLSDWIEKPESLSPGAW